MRCQQLFNIVLLFLANHVVTPAGGRVIASSLWEKDDRNVSSCLGALHWLILPHAPDPTNKWLLAARGAAASTAPCPAQRGMEGQPQLEAHGVLLRGEELSQLWNRTERSVEQNGAAQP